MSYDLHFKFKETPTSSDQVRKYFASRSNYSVEPNQAWYASETGVYFGFNWGLPEDETAKVPSKDSEYDVSFNLNYIRPRPFVLEAEPEVTAFTESFDLITIDPQDHMPDRCYSAEKFLFGWEKGNSFAVSVSNLFQHVPERTQPILAHTLPSDQIEASWLWNLHRPELEKQLGTGVWVPPIDYLVIDGQVRSLISWPDAIPIALPMKAIDYMYLGRIQIAEKWLLFFPKQGEAALATYSSLLKHIEAIPLTEWPVQYRLVSSDRPPQDLVRYFNDQPEIKAKDMKARAQPIRFESILERELFETTESSQTPPV